MLTKILERNDFPVIFSQNTGILLHTEPSTEGYRMIFIENSNKSVFLTIKNVGGPDLLSQ